jgi:hypothetical protein
VFIDYIFRLGPGIRLVGSSTVSTLAGAFRVWSVMPAKLNQLTKWFMRVFFTFLTTGFVAV